MNFILYSRILNFEFLRDNLYSEFMNCYPFAIIFQVITYLFTKVIEYCSLFTKLDANANLFDLISFDPQFTIYLNYFNFILAVILISLLFS